LVDEERVSIENGMAIAWVAGTELEFLSKVNDK